MTGPVPCAGVGKPASPAQVLLVGKSRRPDHRRAGLTPMIRIVCAIAAVAAAPMAYSKPSQNMESCNAPRMSMPLSRNAFISATDQLRKVNTARDSVPPTLAVTL